MLGINCLIKNTTLHELVKDAVNTLGDMYVSTGIIPTVKDIWQEMRANGFEVDVSTVGYVYMTELSTRSSEFFQHAEVEKQSSHAFTRSINKIINQEGVNLMTGEESPVEAVASGLARLYKALTPNVNTKTVQKDLQDILFKGVRRLLPVNATARNSKNFEEIVAAALQDAGTGIANVTGGLNSLKEMQLALKKELQQYIGTLAAKDAFEGAKFADYVNEIMQSSYQLMLNRTDARKIVTDALKDFEDGRFVRVSQTTGAGGAVKKNERIDWRELSKEAKTVTDVANMIQAVFESKLDKKGNRIYSDEDIDIIKTSVAKEYSQVFEKNIVSKITQPKKTTVQIKNDWQKARDIINQVADKFLPAKKTGVKNILARKSQVDIAKMNYAKLELDERYNKGQLTPVEYRQASELIYNIKNGDAVFVTTQEASQFITVAMNELFGNKKLAQLYRDGTKAFPAFVEDFKKSLGVIGYSRADQDLITNSVMPDLENYFQKVPQEVQKLLESRSAIKPTPQQSEEYARLAELQALGAFSDGKFNPLVYKALGVKELPIQSMQQIEAISETINKLLDNVKNPLQANLLFRQLTSDINLILHNNITRSENKMSHVALRTIHHFNLYTQAALNGILMNIFNMAQNVTANTVQMLATSVNLITKADQRYLNKNVKLFWSALIDVGFRDGLVDGLQAGEFANEARLDDYLRRPFKELFTNKSVGDKFLGILKAVLMPFRILGNAYDVAAKAVNTKKLFTLALNDVLAAKGYDKEGRYKLISDSLYDGKLIADSISEAERLMQLIGEPANPQRAYRMAQQIIAYKIVDSGTISEAEFSAISKTAFKVSGKGLGHEYQYEHKDTNAKNIVVQGTSLPGRLADEANKLTQIWKNSRMGSNDKTGYAIASLVDNVKTAIFTKFIGGATRWIPLTVQSMGFGILAYSQLGKKIDLLAANGSLKNEQELRGDLEKRLTKNEAFFRGLTGIAYSYTIGLIVRALLNTDCDENDPECMKEKESAMAYVKEKISSKIDPHGNMMKIAFDAFDGKGEVFDKDSKKFIFQLFNVDNKFSPYEQINSSLQNIGLFAMDNPKQKPDKQEGMGMLGRIIGAPYTNPINAYFKAYDVVTKGKPAFEQATTLKFGVFGGGLTERVGALKYLGIENEGVTGFSGVGGATVDVLRSRYNISTKAQLKAYIKQNGFDNLKRKVVSKTAKKGFYERKIFTKVQEASIRAQLTNK